MAFKIWVDKNEVLLPHHAKYSIDNAVMFAGEAETLQTLVQLLINPVKCTGTIQVGLKN